MLESAGDWKLREYDDKCRVSRVFGSGEDRVTLWLDQGGAPQIYNLTLIGRPLRNPYGPAVRIRFGEEEETIRSYISLKSSKGRPVITMYGVTLVQPEMEKDEDASLPKITVGSERMSAIDSLRIRTGVVNPMRLELGPMALPFGYLQDCGDRLEIALSNASRAISGETTAPEPIDYDQWLNPSDYPAYLLRSGMEGTIHYRLTVRSNGSPGSCYVTKSNKPQLFDDVMCLGLMKRARFKPATGRDGEPITSYYEGKVTFRLR